ncbi:cytochrome p450 [Marasmius crinis-equi]|uniref:Cytochrome p450 n=1 Tax=Marasmius crinis-equi TaxID=585013 RepID=A0ABR3FSC1_9AGAR
MPSLLASVSIFVAIFVLPVMGLKRVLDRRRRKALLHYHPGPPPSGLITGHLSDMPAKKPWITYTAWTKQYGDVIHLEALGDHIILINSFEAANDLLEKRSRIYSNRPHVHAGEISGWMFNLTFLPHTDEWRRARRTYQQNFRPDAVRAMAPMITDAIGQLTKQLLAKPQNFADHILVLSAGISLKAMFGITVKSSDDPLLPLAVEAIHTLDGVWVPNFIIITAVCPFIRYVPKWVPLLGSTRAFIDRTRECLRELQRAPLERAMADIKAGRENNSIMGDALRKLISEGGSVDSPEFARTRDMASTTYVASADTFLSSVKTFFLAMARNPICQEKAQKEIDEIVGRGRLPSFEDRKSLPYVEAVYREVMRWHPAIPIGPAHATSEDDMYNGHYIPKGALILPNIWAMTRDERRYKNPDDFIPERFLDVDGKLNKDDVVLAFGFGRRICVGRHFGDAVVWMTIASVLACFKIAKDKDENGREIDVPEKYSDGPGQFSYPLPFKCAITPRYPGVEALV